MNGVIETIENRRSVRKYKPEQIKDEQLEAIIRAGLYAPSAVNQQSWHLTVIRNRDILDSLSRSAKETLAAGDNEYLKGYAKMEKFHVFYNAPTAVLVSFDKNAIAPMADCSAAIQNMLLAAESLGVGSCWIGMTAPYFSGGSHNAEFGIPETHQPVYAVTLGYSDSEKGKAPERKVGTVNYLN
jgi:nitroreductase